MTSVYNFAILIVFLSPNACLYASGNDEDDGRTMRRMLHSCKPIPKDDTPDEEQKNKPGSLCPRGKDVAGGTQHVLPVTGLLLVGACVAAWGF